MHQLITQQRPFNVVFDGKPEKKTTEHRSSTRTFQCNKANKIDDEKPTAYCTQQKINNHEKECFQTKKIESIVCWYLK